MLRLLKDAGANVQVATGFIEPSILSQIGNTYSVSVTPYLDRSYQGLEGDALIRRIVDSIYEKAKDSNLLLFSQPFSGDAPHFAEAVAEVALGTSAESWHRSHDPIRLPHNFTVLKGLTRALPTTNILSRQMREINPDVKIVVVPPCIDEDRLNNVLELPEVLRQRHNIGNNDILLVQPTRVDPNKRIDKAIELAVRMEEDLARRGNKRKVHLIVSGGESSEKSRSEQQRLELLAKKSGFGNLFFLGGTERVADYIRAADFVTFMSEQEGWGMPPAEAAYLGVPCVVAPYTDQYGQPIFQEVYGGFDFIVDDNKGKTISQSTVDRAIDLVTDLSMGDQLRLNNKLKVARYTKGAMKETLDLLLRQHQNRGLAKTT